MTVFEGLIGPDADTEVPRIASFVSLQYSSPPMTSTATRPLYATPPALNPLRKGRLDHPAVRGIVNNVVASLDSSSSPYLLRDRPWLLVAEDVEVLLHCGHHLCVLAKPMSVPTQKSLDKALQTYRRGTCASRPRHNPKSARSSCAEWRSFLLTTH